MNQFLVAHVCVLIAAMCTFCGGRASAEMVLVDKGVAMVPVVVADNAAPSTLEAARELIDYIGKISGARPALIVGSADTAPASAIWVGSHPKLASLFSGVNLSFAFPEETLIVCNDRHVAILGRDQMVGEIEIEHGTANAVYTFIEKFLHVRWLWPGPLGEDVPQRDTIAIGAVEHRFHPQFRKRKFWPEIPADWFRRQRLKLHSYPFGGGHAYTDWWEKYGETHPEYFALQPDGTRHPDPKRVKDVKLCMSNPGVWKQWLDNVAQTLEAEPSRIMFSASPNDGPGECICAECRAWDDPAGPPVRIYGRGGVTDSPSLSDRHVRYWNILARGLKERFPDRDLSVGAYAYGTYRTPPISQALEPNIVIGYVGHFPLANDAVTEQEKAAWEGWAAKASGMVFRPNLFHYSGGWLGLPTVATRRTIADFRWLAEHKCVGVEVDTLPHSWATQGVQFYLMAQLAYDPMQDGNAVLKDYYHRAFGPAAGDVERYFQIMEAIHEKSLDGIKHSGAFARQAIALYEQVYTDAELDEAGALLDRAAASAADGPQRYPQRVAFVRVGYDLTRLQIQIMRTMRTVRETEGRDQVAVRKAIALCDAREAMFNEHQGIALKRAAWYHNSRKLDDYMGPPTGKLGLASAQESDDPAEHAGRD